MALGGAFLLGSIGSSGSGSPSTPQSNPGEPDPEPLASFGAAIDGYLANALVWRDANGDQQWNPGEHYVFTDASGLFKNLTSGPGTLRLAGLTPELRALLTNESSDPTTDISTGKTFTGILSAPEGSSVITPLTTLVVATGGDAVKLAALKTALGIDPSIDLSQYDPLATLVSGNATPAQIAAALKVQTASLKIANLMSMAATAVQSLDANFSLSDMVASVAESLVEQASSPGGLKLDEPDALSATLQAAASGAGVTIDSATLTAAATAMASVNTSMTSSVSTAILAAANGLSLNDALSVMTQAVASQLVVQESLLPAVAASASSGGDITINTSSFSGDALLDQVNAAKSSVETLVVAPPTQSLMVAVDDFGLINKAGAADWTALSGNLVSNDLSGNAAKQILAAVKGTTTTAGSLTPLSSELSLTGVYGTLVVKANGSYTYTVTNSGLANSLVTDTFTYQVGSGNSTDLGTLTLTLDARNDAPKVSAVQLALESAGAVSAAKADLLAGATDADGDALTVNQIKGQSDFASTGPWEGQYGTLSLVGGKYTYQLDPANASVNALAPNATVRDVFLFGVTDGTATTQSALTVTITGSAVVGSAVLLVDSDTSNNGLNTISESAASGTTVANLLLQGSDADTGAKVTLSLVGNANGLFVLDGNQIKLAAGKNLDFETASNHTIAVKATSSDGGSVTQNFTIAVTNVNEAPVITSGTTGSVAENAAVNTVVYTAQATDVDANTTLVYSLGGTDAASFDIDASSGAVTLKAAANFEAQSSYNIQVIASDGVLSDSKAVTISVTDVNEAPFLLQNSPTDFVLIKAKDLTPISLAGGFADPEQNALTYSLTGELPAGLSFDASTATFSGTPTTDGSYSVTLRVSDSKLSSDQIYTLRVVSQPVVVSVSADKAAAKAGDSLTFTVTLSEPVTIDTTYGTPVLVFDVDGKDMLAEYRAVFGSGTSTATTVLTFVATAIAGTDTQVTIKSLSLGNATVTGNLTGQSLSTVTSARVDNFVVDNSEPVFTSGISVIVEENIATTTVVYTASAIDDTAVSYRLWGPNSSAFNLSNGVLTFKNPPDFETFSSYVVCIDATDAAGNTRTQNLIIGVTDVNEAPTAITLNNVVSSLPENTSTSSRVKVADIAVTDDAKGTHTIMLTGADAGLFEVIGNALYLRSGVVLNHESVKNNYAVTVSVGDTTVNGSTVSAQYTLGVSNVNEAPIYTSGSLTDQTVQVGAATSIVVPTNAFTDPDVGAKLSYLAYVDGVLIASQNWISFNAATRTFALNADASQLGAHTLTVEASDGSLTTSHTFDLDVTLPVGQGILKSHIAQLTDYLDNPNTIGTADYTQANASSVTGSFNSSSGLLNLGSAALKVTRGNLLHISDGNPDTVGNAPLLSLPMGAVPSGEAKRATLQIALTRGLDSVKDAGESQVSVLLNVDMLQVGGQWVMRAAGTSASPQKASVQISSSLTGYEPIGLPFDFDSNDLIASTSGSGDNLQLNINAFALLTKLNNSSLGSSLGSVLGNGTYTLSIQQQSGDALPLLSRTGQALDGVALTLTVDSNTNNQTPFLALGSDLQAIQLAIAPEQILSLGQFLQSGGGTDTNGGPRFALTDPENNLSKIWLLQPQSGTYGLRQSATEITWFTNYQTLSDVRILPLNFSDLSKLVYQAPAALDGAASVSGLGLQFMLEDNQQNFSPLHQLAVKFNGALSTQSLATEGSAALPLLTLATSQDIQSLPTQGKLFFVRGDSRTEIKATGTSLLAGDRLEYEAPAAGDSQASAGEVLLRSFDNANDTYTFTTLALQVNHLPSLTVTGTAKTVTEDSDTVSTSVTVTVSDIDSNVLSWPDWTVKNGVLSKTLTYGVATLSPVSGGEYTLSYALDPVRSQSLNTTPVNEVLTLVVSDGLGGTASRTVTFVVQGVNDGAAFVKLDDSTPFDAVRITEGAGPVTGRLVVSDIDSPATVQTNQSAGEFGQFEVTENGAWTYTPNGNLNALKAQTYTDEFVVTTADGTTKSVTVTIQGVNDAPVPKGFSDNVKINQVATFDLVQDSTDPEGDLFTATQAVLRQGGGQVSLVNGVVTFTPATNFSGQVYIDYTLKDANNATSNGVISLFVGDNTPPTGKPVLLSTLEDTHLVFTAANFGFEDADLGQSFSAVRIDSLPLAGVLKLGANNVVANQVIPAADIAQLSFVPAANASATGYASFTFSVQDSAGAFAASPSTVTINVAPVNDLPEVTSVTSVSVPENTSSDFYTATATDIDSAVLTYSISGADADMFTIDASTGALKFAEAPNFEAPGSAAESNTYSIVLEVSDGVGKSTQALSIVITNVNEAPVITSDDEGTVAENAAISTVVYTATAEDVDANTKLTYSLSGTDANLFNIDPSSGVVKLNASAKYEGKASYSINVVASDGVVGEPGTLSATKPVTINVQDLGSDGAAIDGYLANALVWRDADGDKQFDSGESYVFTDASGAFKDLTNGSGTLRLASLTDELRALLTNAPSGDTTDISTGKTFTGVLSAPEGSTVVTPLTTLVVATDGDAVKLAALKTALGIDASIDLSTYDPLATLVSANATPAQIAAALQVQTASLKIANLIGMAATAVQSLDANFSLSDMVNSVAQSLVAQASTTGLNLDTSASLSTTLQAAAAGAGVTIDSATLTAAATAMASVNTNMTSSVSTAILAAVNGLSLSDALTVMTQAVASQLVVQESLLPAVAASASSGGAIAINTSSYSGIALQALVTAAKSGVATLVVADASQSTMVAVDDFGLINKPGSAAWTVLSGNLVSNDLSGNAAKQILAAVKGTTSTADTLTPLSSELSLTGLYGTLVVKADGRYTYTVTDRGLANSLVTDTFTYQVGSGNSTDLGTLTLALDSQNDAPKVSAVQLALESAGAVSAATADLLAGATDADGDALTVNQIKGQSDFASTGPWVGQYGTLSLVNGKYTYQLDPANDSVNALTPNATVRDVFLFSVTDGTATTPSTLTVTITGSAVVGSPVLLVDSNNGLNTISENAASGTAVANLQLQGSDADGSTVTLSLVGNPNGLFVLDGNQVKLASGKSLDYETATSHTIAVKALSSDGGSVTQAFTINVTDVNEAPVIVDTGVGNITMAENAIPGTAVSGLTLSATDVDAGTSVTLSLEDDADGLFELLDGQIKLASGKSLDYENASSHTITVQATSTDGSSVTQNFTIAVTDVNEAPVRSLTQIAAKDTATEDTVKVFTAAELIANYTDPEGNSRSVASVGSATNGTVVLNDNGTVSFTPAADFSGAASFSYTVKDASGLIGEATTVNLTVDNVNDPVQGSVLVTSADGSNKANIALTANTAGLSDADGLGTLAYQWQQSADGQIWTNIVNNATSSNFTPGNDLIGQSVRVQISYTDLKGQAESVSSATVLVLNPVDPNSTPALTGTAYSFSAIDEDSAVTVTVAELLQGYSDADLDVLSVKGLQVTNATFVANSVNNVVVSYTLTPTANYNGTVALSYQITDGKANIDVTKSITVNAVNDAPVLVNPLVDQTVQAAQSKTFAFASDAFADVDGDALTYTATTSAGLELPSWLVFNADDRSFTVSPLGNDVGVIDVKVTASDSSPSLSASDIFRISVTAPTGQAMLKDTTSVFTNYLDTTNNGLVDYTTSQAALLDGVYDNATRLLKFATTGIKIARGNVLALADNEVATVGTAPTLGLQLANVPTIAGTLSSTIDIALTAGLDARHDKGESRVWLSLDIDTRNDEGQLVMRAQTQKATIYVTNGSGTLKGDVEFDFNASDIIASTSTSGGQALLQFNVMSLLAKLDGTVYGQLLGQFLNDGNYTLSIVKTAGADWPLQTDAGKPINGITVGLPITSAAINFVPQLVFGDDIKTGLALDIPPQTVLDLGQFLLTGAGFNGSSDQVKRFALSDANGPQDLFKIWFLQPENGQGTLGLRDANGAIAPVQDGQYQALGSEKIYGLAFADLGRLVYTAPNAVADASVNLRFLLEDQQRAFSTIQSIAIDLKPGLQQSSIVTEGQELVLQELSYASTVESLPTQGKVYSVQGESRTELKLGDEVPANAKLVYVGPVVDASSLAPAGQWSVRGFDPVTDTYVTTTQVLAINHLPTISASSNTPATLSEDDTKASTVQITLSDEDSADTAVINLTGWTPGQNGAYTQSLQYGVATLSPVSGQAGQYTLSYSVDARSQALGDTLAQDPLTLTVLDSQGASRQTTVTFQVQGIDDAATFAAAQGKLFDTVSITETDEVQTFTGQVLVSDVDSATTVKAQTTVGNYGTFSIGANGAWTYTTKSALNELKAADKPSEEFTITTADGTTKDIIVNITGTNDAPVAVDGATVGTFGINTEVVINLAALISDPDNTDAQLTVSAPVLTQGEGAVALEGQQLTFIPEPNFSGSVTISYTVLDTAGLSDTGTVTFFVGVNTAPTSSNTTLTINEDSTRALTSEHFAFADPDAGQSTLGKVIIKSVPSKGQLFTVVNGLEVMVKANDAFTLDELDAGDLKYRPANNDYGISYASFNFQVADSGNLASTETYTLVLDVAAVNDLPVIDSATSFSVQENTSSVFYTATATDVEKDPLTFSINGADADKFTMDPNTGTLKFTAAPNFEAPGSAAGSNIYSIQLVVNDGDEELVTKDLTITVTNVNEAPVIDSGATGTVAENSAIGTEVYKARANDVDASTTLTYSLGGGDARFFNINPSTGVVTLKTSPNFETLGRSPDYSIDVTASDGTLSATKAVVITVTDVNEAPTAISLSANSLTENQDVESGIKIGDITITDPDATGNKNVLTVSDTTNFKIEGNALYFIGTNPDFETKSSYSVTITSTDGALTQSQAFTINVDNVIDTLTLADNTIRVTDHDSSGRPTTTLVEAQSNSSGTLTLSLGGTDALNRVNLLRLLDGDKNTTGIAPTIEFALQNTDKIALDTHQVHLDLALSNERFNGLSVSVGVDLAIELTRTADGVLQLTMPATPVVLVVKAGGFTVLTKTVQNLDSDTISLVGGSNGIPNLSVKIDNLFDKAMDSTVAIRDLDSAGTLAIASGLVMGLLGGKTVGDLLALLKEVVTVPNGDDLPSANLTQLFALIKDTISLPADLQQLSFDQVLSVSAQVLNLPDSLKFGDVLTLLRDTIVLPSSLQGTLGSLKGPLVDATDERTVNQLESLARAMLGGTQESIADKTIPELLDLLADSTIAGQSIQSLGSGAVSYFEGYNTIALFNDAARVVEAFYGHKTLSQLLAKVQSNITLPAELADLQALSLVGLLDLGALAMAAQGLLGSNNLSINGLLNLVQSIVTINGNVDPSRISDLLALIDNGLDLQPLLGTDVNLSDLISNLNDPTLQIHALMKIAAQTFLSSNGEMTATVDLPTLGLTDATGQLIDQIVVKAPIASIDQLTLDSAYVTVHDVNQNNEDTSFSVLGEQTGGTLTLDLSAGQVGTALNRSNILQLFDGDPQTGRSPTLQFALKDTHDVPLGLSTVGVLFSIQNDRLASLTLAADFEVQIKLVRDNSGQLQIELPPQTVQIALSAAGMPVTTVQVSNLSPDMFELVSGTNGTPSLSLKIDSLLDKAIGNTLALGSLSEQGSLTLAAGVVMGLVGGKSVGELLGLLKDSVDLSGDLPATSITRLLQLVQDTVTLPPALQNLSIGQLLSTAASVLKLDSSLTVGKLIGVLQDTFELPEQFNTLSLDDLQDKLPDSASTALDRIKSIALAMLQEDSPNAQLSDFSPLTLSGLLDRIAGSTLANQSLDSLGSLVTAQISGYNGVALIKDLAIVVNGLIGDTPALELLKLLQESATLPAALAGLEAISLAELIDLSDLAQAAADLLGPENLSIAGLTKLIYNAVTLDGQLNQAQINQAIDTLDTALNLQPLLGKDYSLRDLFSNLSDPEIEMLPVIEIASKVLFSSDGQARLQLDLPDSLVLHGTTGQDIQRIVVNVDLSNTPNTAGEFTNLSYQVDSNDGQFDLGSFLTDSYVDPQGDDLAGVLIDQPWVGDLMLARDNEGQTTFTPLFQNNATVAQVSLDELSQLVFVAPTTPDGQVLDLGVELQLRAVDTHGAIGEQQQLQLAFGNYPFNGI